MDDSRPAKIALRWTPAGKRKRGRPKGTQGRTIEQEMKEIGKTWNNISRLAPDRCDWKKTVEALCTEHDED